MKTNQSLLNARGGNITPVIVACYYKKGTYNFLFAPRQSGHRQPAVIIEYEQNT